VVIWFFQEDAMKRLMLCAVLVLAPTVLAADAGLDPVVQDAGTVLALSDAGTALALSDAGNAGAFDAGIPLVVGDDVNVVGIAKKLKETGHSKSWTVLFGIMGAVVVLTWLARKVGGSVIPALKTDRGGALTVLILGVGGGVVNALAAGNGLSLDGALSGAVTSFMAAGGYTIVKKLLFPSDPAPAQAAKPS
jgi:hypothetical protein